MTTVKIPAGKEGRPAGLSPLSNHGYSYMPDPIRKCFGYGQLWPLPPSCSQNQAGSDFPHPIRFRSSKEGSDHAL